MSEENLLERLVATQRRIIVRRSSSHVGFAVILTMPRAGRMHIARRTNDRVDHADRLEKLAQAASLGIVRITTKRRYWTKYLGRLCGTELAPLDESGGTIQLEIFAAAEMALQIEMIVYR